MEIYQKIRYLREINQLSQEEVAEQLGMSVTGYAKIERGETKDIGILKLEKIAHIFNIDLIQLLQSEKYIVSINNNNNQNGTQYNSNYYATPIDTAIQVEQSIKTLSLELTHKDEIIKNKDVLIEQLQKELVTLKELIDLFKNSLK